MPRRRRRELFVYTSILLLPTRTRWRWRWSIARRKRSSAASGLPFVLLRNGWYTENYTAGLAAALRRGAVLGAARDGRVSSAARADFAAAGATVLASPANQAGRVYELAGDSAYTLAELAAEFRRQSAGRSSTGIIEADYKAALQADGLPEQFAALYAESASSRRRWALSMTRAGDRAN